MNSGLSTGIYEYDLKQYVEWMLNELKPRKQVLSPQLPCEHIFQIFMKEYCTNEQSLENNMMKRSRINSGYSFMMLSKDVTEEIMPYITVRILSNFSGDNWSLRYLKAESVFNHEEVINECEKQGVMLVLLLMINDYYVKRKTNMCVFETDSRYAGNKSFEEILNGRCDLY